MCNDDGVCNPLNKECGVVETTICKGLKNAYFAGRTDDYYEIFTRVRAAYVERNAILEFANSHQAKEKGEYARGVNKGLRMITDAVREKRI